MTDSVYRVLTAAPARTLATRLSRQRNGRDSPGFTASSSLLHGLGWGLYLQYDADYPPLVGLGFVALHVRPAPRLRRRSHRRDRRHRALHAAERKEAARVGLFFSFGHSTIVLCLAVAIALRRHGRQAGTAPRSGTSAACSAPAFRERSCGSSAIFNLLVLLDILGVWRRPRPGRTITSISKNCCCARGLLNRLFGGRLQKVLNHSWQMYPLGLLFGLGFDTASEVGLLAMTAGASAGNLPFRHPLPADPVRRRHVGDGHHRRRADVEGLQLGVPEPVAQDLLQHHHHRSVDRRRAGDRQHRVAAGLDPACSICREAFWDFVAGTRFRSFWAT